MSKRKWAPREIIWSPQQTKDLCEAVDKYIPEQKIDWKKISQEIPTLSDFTTKQLQSKWRSTGGTKTIYKVRLANLEKEVFALKNQIQQIASLQESVIALQTQTRSCLELICNQKIVSTDFCSAMDSSSDFIGSEPECNSIDPMFPVEED